MSRRFNVTLVLSKETRILCERHVVVVFGSITKTSRAQQRSYTEVCSVIIVKIWMGLCQWMEKRGAWTQCSELNTPWRLQIHKKTISWQRFIWNMSFKSNLLWGFSLRSGVLCSDNCATALPHKIRQITPFCFLRRKKWYSTPESLLPETPWSF